MTSTPVFRLSALPVLALLTTLVLTPVDTQAQGNRISVTGEGVIELTPDQAVLSVGIVSYHEDPERARALNGGASASAMNTLRELGIEERHLKVETLRLQPRQEYDRDTRAWNQVGFEAVRQVSVTVTDLDKLPEVVARVVQEGANRLDGIQYDISNRDEVRNEALRLAAENARTKATILAETLGATLGPVAEISEGGVSIPRPRVLMEMVTAKTADMAAPEPDAYAAGELEVTANVSVSFYLLPASRRN